ncbi:UNVERIFIED_CONTAM: hypothetical protein RMT77_011159 [Armadillidium vulgare]
MEYGDAHRAFLQILLQYRVLTAREVKSTFDKICKHFGGELKDLKEFILKINEHLEPLQMVIRKGIQEEKDSDVSCFVLVNNLNNELTRSCSSFTKQELGYLKLLVENVVMSDNGEIGIMAALALGSERQPRLKATLVENLIDRLVEEKWLIREEGILSLSALTMCELYSYLEHHFEDNCLKCYFCSNYTLKGYTCPACDTKGHRNCLENFWKRSNCTNQCAVSSCGAKWEDSTSTKNKRRRTISEDY